MDDIVALTLRVNDFLSGLFLGVGITLVDFKLEYGRLCGERGRHAHRARRRDQPGQLPACGTRKTNEKMDKDRFRRDLGRVEEAYQEVAQAGWVSCRRPGSRDLKGPEAMQ